ncbi:MAG: T9SS type A sorting domain-containing protein [Bacteroidota bacterium]
MKKMSLCLFLLFTLPSIMNAQYYEWAMGLHPTLSHGTDPIDIAVDSKGNSLVYSFGIGCYSITCYQSFITKFNANGDSVWQYTQFPNCAYPSSIAVDAKGNSFVTGTSYSGIICPDIIIAGDTLFGGNGYLIKVDSNGIAKWAVNLTYGTYAIAVDKPGNIYLTDGTKTEKRNYLGNLLWTNNFKGGHSIAVDASNKPYVLNSDSIYKLNNSNGNVIWSKKSYNGKKLTVRADGFPYILNGDSLIKLNTVGNIVWVKNNTRGNDIAVDSLGRVIVADSNSVFRINASGTVKQWTRTGSDGFFTNVALDNLGNPYFIGSRSVLNQTIFCPFQLFVDRMCMGLSPVNIFVTKINTVSSLPFQLGVFTGAPLSCSEFQNVGYICTGKSFSVTYYSCAGSGSSFNSGNQFQMQLSDNTGNFNNAVVVGAPNNFIIPETTLESTGYRLRVVSTNPVVEGVPNIPGCFTEVLYVNPTISQILPQGSTTFCQGGSVQLKAKTDEHYRYEWLRNDTLISSGYYDTLQTASINGIYKLVVIDKSCACTDTSFVNVIINSLPQATITAQGPTTFCNGDSVILTANSGAGYTYQWKVNNVNIPFAFYQSYTAKQAGNYRVKVSKSNGCNKLSTPIAVTVPCREEEMSFFEDNSINVLPNPTHNNFTLIFDNTDEEKITLKIYNTLGEEMTTPGNFNVDSDYSFGENLPYGIYFLEIRKGNKTRKMKIVKL